MHERYAQMKTLDIRQEDRLLRLTLNRPESLNAIGGGMHEELEETFGLIRFDDSVGAVLLTGAGRAFSSGGDVKGMAASSAQGSRGATTVGNLLLGAKRLITNMLDIEQPIVSAIQGYAMGLGASIALCADIPIAADNAQIADTHVSIGLVAGDGGALIWPLLLPVNTAKYYLMTGERISGSEAARLGLVVKSVPADELTRAAEEVAQRLAQGPSLAIRWTKYSVNKVLRERLNLLFDTAGLLEGATFLSEDHKEATAAFVEKRAPTFKGH